VLYYFIALAWTAVFYVASGKLSLLRRRPVLWGPMYGGFVYLFMNVVVLPLSYVPHAPNAMSLASRVNGVLAVVLCIGLTISVLVVRNHGLSEFCMQVKPNEVRAATRRETLSFACPINK
jgi:hypothetical protein